MSRVCVASVWLISVARPVSTLCSAKRSRLGRPSVSQAAATIVAISNNFFLNNALTYRDQRLKGRSLLLGWLSFNLVCATGAAANIGVADWLFERNAYWVVSAIADELARRLLMDPVAYPRERLLDFSRWGLFDLPRGVRESR